MCVACPCSWQQHGLGHRYHGSAFPPHGTALPSSQEGSQGPWVGSVVLQPLPWFPPHPLASSYNDKHAKQVPITQKPAWPDKMEEKALCFW